MRRQWPDWALDWPLDTLRPRLKCLEKRSKRVAERVGFEPTDGTLEIKMLLENWERLVPSEPLASPFVPVDSASSRVRDTSLEIMICSL